MSNLIENITEQLTIIQENNATQEHKGVPDESHTTKEIATEIAKENVLKGKFAVQQIYTELGLVDSDFTIEVEKENPDGTTRKDLHTVFAENAAGDLVMTPYNLNRTLWQKDIAKTKDAKAGGTKQVTYSIIRVAEPDKYGKYKYPSREIFADTMPLIPPILLEKFERKERIKTLVLTEGYKKAMCASVHANLDIIGLPSITHITEKEADRAEALFTCVSEIIEVCKVQNVIILFDADASQVSIKNIEDEKEATIRPKTFASQVSKIRERLKDFDIDVFFAYGKNMEEGKGLDDLISHRGFNTATEIAADLTTYNGTPKHFFRVNTAKVAKIYDVLNLNDVQAFYAANFKKIEANDFVFNGTKYYFDKEKQNVLEVPKPDVEVFNFYELIDNYTAKGEYTGTKISIIAPRVIDRLREMNFRRISIEGNKILAHIENNIVTEVEIEDIINKFMERLYKLPLTLVSEDGNEVDRERLEHLVMTQQSKYFNENMMYNLNKGEDDAVEFNNDTATVSYFYYRNCYVKVTKDGVEKKTYTELKKAIWREQILDRDFTPLESLQYIGSSWSLFINFTAGNYFENGKEKDPQRAEDLMRIIGYLMHRYYERDLRTVILTDSKDSDGKDNGRSGKGLISKGISRMLNTTPKSPTAVTIDGKDFDVHDRFKWQDLFISTKFLHISDVKKNFDFASLFNVIEEGVPVQKKNMQPFSVALKIVISTNSIITIEGSSAEARSLQFQTSTYFDGKNRTPLSEFNEWFFSADWTPEKWNMFDNFMLNNVLLYLKKGLPKVKNFNLEERKLTEGTCVDFIEFMGTIAREDVKWKKKALFEEFKKRYSDWNNEKFKQNRFSNWLNKFHQYNSEGWRIEEERLREEGDSMLTFKKEDKKD